MTNLDALEVPRRPEAEVVRVDPKGLQRTDVGGPEHEGVDRAPLESQQTDRRHL